MLQIKGKCHYTFYAKLWRKLQRSLGGREVGTFLASLFSISGFDLQQMSETGFVGLWTPSFHLLHMHVSAEFHVQPLGRTFQFKISCKNITDLFIISKYLLLLDF